MLAAAMERLVIDEQRVVRSSRPEVPGDYLDATS
jgi:hypothetical protein